MPTSHSAAPLRVIVLAHGPAAATLTSTRQFEDFVGGPEDIVVVAATLPGVTAVERAADRSYTTIPDHGPDAIRAALEHVESDGGASPIVMIHDDVSLGEGSLDRLLSTHGESGQLTVPERIGAERVSADSEIDMICAVGSAEQLRRTVERAAFWPGMRITENVIVARNTSAAHESTCQQRFIAPRDLTRPLIVAAMIVRDEEEHLAECIASLDGLVDRVEVADTGSLDGTVAIAKESGANVIEIQWRDDFAWARNQVLERCRDASYMLWIDADERLVCDDPEAVRALLGTFQRLYPAYSMNIQNYRADGDETHRFVARRIVDPELVAFEGALHEQPLRHDGAPLVTAFLSNLSIAHLGYDESVVDLEEKMARNLDIAQRSFDEDPSEQHAVHLARALKGASSDPEVTLRQIEPLMRTIDGAEAPVRALINGVRAELLLTAERFDEAAAAARQTLELVPADALAGAVLAQSLFRSHRVEEVLQAAAEYDARPSPEPLLNDVLAAQTRARIVFESAIRLGDLETAKAQVELLPPDVDPWSVLASHLAVDELAELGELAGRIGDERFLRVFITSPELDSATLENTVSRFERGTTIAPTTVDLLNSVRADLQQVEGAPELRRRFESSGEPNDAIAYARCLSVGFVDLQVELDDITSDTNDIGRALDIAAEGNHRRGRIAEARIDAEASLATSPEAARSTIILASDHLALGEADRALELVASSRDASTGRPARTARHQLASIASRAHLALDDLPAAVREGVEIVDDGGSLEHWEQLLQAAESDMEQLALVLGLALLGDEEAFVDAVARAVSPGRTAEICGSYLALGGTNPDAVSTGVLAATLAGQNALASVIAQHGELLPPEIRSRLADHLREVGAADVALRLLADSHDQLAVPSPR